jgi:hypothetical protein
MRLFSLSLLIAVTLVAAGSLRPAHAATTPHTAPAAAHAHEQSQADANDDSRVEVQITVLVAALTLVVVIGTGAYFLRKRLGLTAPPPKQDAGGHH